LERKESLKAPFQILLSRLGPLLFLGGIGCLYLDSFILPFTPIYQGDTVPIYLLEAVRMLHGQVTYRDFFQFTFPGTQVFYLLLFDLFGVRAWIPTVVFVLLGLSLAWVGVSVSRRLMSGSSVFLPSLLFISFAFTTEMDPTHHWFSLLIVMGALAVVIERRSFPRIAAAGALCGLATFFTQSRGLVAVLGFAVFLLWEWHATKENGRWLLKAQTCLFAPFLATTAGTIAYFVWKVGLDRFLSCTLVFPLRYYPQWFWNTLTVYMTEVPKFSSGLEVPALAIWLFIHALLPLVYLLFLARHWREAQAHPRAPWDRLMLVTILGLFMFLGIASSPNWMRLCSVCLPALILFVWSINSPGRLPRSITILLWIGGVVALVVQPTVVQTGWRGYLKSPLGRAAFLDSDRYEKYRWVAERTREGDFFYQADDVDLYFLLGLRNPTPVSFVTGNSYTRPEQVQSVIEALEREKVRFVVWSAFLDVRRTISADKDNLGPLRAYLQSHYHAVKSFSDSTLEEAWERSR
jgi:hypothetical protein